MVEMKRKGLVLMGLLLGCAFQGVFAQLGGIKTIDPTGVGASNYTTFTAAILDLNGQGVAPGGVTFHVAAGAVFTENLPVLRASGSAADPVVFQKLGTGANPKIVPAVSGSLTPASLNDHGDAILRVAGGDYITFNGIDVEDNPAFVTNQTRYEYGYMFYRLNANDGCKHVVVRNARISLNRSNGSSVGLYQSDHDTLGAIVAVASTGGRCDSNSYGGLVISANTGVYLRGYAATDMNFYDYFTQIGIIDPDTIYAGGGTTAGYGIYSIYQHELVLANNWIFAGNFGSFTHTSTLYGVFLSTANNANATIRDNHIQVISSATTTETNGISSTAGANGAGNKLVFQNNSVENCSLIASTTATFNGIRSTGSASRIEFSGNKVTGFRRTAGTSGPNRMLEVTGVKDSAWINSNIIDDNTATSTGELLGLSLSGATTCKTEVRANLIDRMSSTGGNVTGIEMDAATYLVHENMIRRLQSGATNTTADVSGIILNVSLQANLSTIYNNVVTQLYLPSSANLAAIKGIDLLGNSPVNLYHNTVYLDASSSGTNFGTTALNAAISSTMAIRNNIFVNNSTPAGTGQTVAYTRASYSFTKYSILSNYNIFYAGTPGSNRLLFKDDENVALNIDRFRNISGMEGRESFSVQELPPFLNTSTSPYNLNISTSTPTQVEGLGVRISSPISISTDINGNPRGASSVDAGAYEGNYTKADLTGPGISFPALKNYTVFNRNVANVNIVDAGGVNVNPGTAPRLYYKKSTDNNTFAGNTSADNGWKYVEANNTSSPFNFTTDYTLLMSPVAIGDTIEYFIVAQDNNGSPNVGVNNALFNTQPGGVSLTAGNFPVSGTSRYVIVNGLSGSILVGPGQTYTTLTRDSGVFQLINRSVVSGNLSIRVTGDITNENGAVALSEFAEEGAGGYRISIVPNSAGLKQITGAATGAMIKFNLADRISIDGRFGGTGRNLLLRNTTTSASAAVQLIGNYISNGNGSDNIVIRNCIIEGGSNTSNSAFGIIFATPTALTTAPTGFGCNNALITENLIRRAYQGIYTSGTNVTGPVEGLVISNNFFGSYNPDSAIGLNSININITNNANIFGNTVVGQRLSTTGVLVGIRVGTNTFGNRVYGNRISNIIATNTSTSAANAIGIHVTSGDSTYIYNNLIYNIQSSNSSLTTIGVITAGIRIDAGSYHKIYYNSVNLYGTPATGTAAGASAALVINGAASEQLDIRNNIFSNKMNRSVAGSKSYAVWFIANFDFTASIINRNAYFVPAGPSATTSFFMARSGTSDLLNRAALRATTGQDLNSHPYKNITAPFTNDSTLAIPAATVTAAESQGEVVAAIGLPNLDFNGLARPAGSGTAPDLGALEFEGASGLDFTPPIIDSFTFNAQGQCAPTARTVTAYVRDNAGGIGVDSVSIFYSINGAAQPPVNMSLISGTPYSGIWSGVMPASPLRNSEVLFYLIAKDSSENSTLPSQDTAYKDGYIVVTAGPGVTINEGRSAIIYADNNVGGTVNWSPGGLSGDTINTGILTTTTWFYATVTDGICSHTDSVLVTVISPPVKPVADFDVSSQNIYISDELSLYDLSSNLPDIWKWTISPSTFVFTNGTTDTTKEPTVRFTRDGVYTIKLVAANPAGADSIEKVGYVTVTLDYCALSFPNSVNDYLNGMSLNGMSNPGTGGTPGGYSDYSVSNPALTTTLNADGTYRLELQNGLVNVANMAAWMDFNKNGNFNDPGEKLGEIRFVGPALDTAIYFTVPSGVTAGPSRLRIIATRYTNINLQPCNNYTLGEIEDYLVNFCDVNSNPLEASADFCPGDSVLLDALNPGAAYLWNTGATGSQLYVATPGKYWVTVITAACSATDTIEVLARPGFAGTDIIPAAVSGGNHLGGTLSSPDQVCAGSHIVYELQPPAAYGNAGYSGSWFYFVDEIRTLSGTMLAGNYGSTTPAPSGNGILDISAVPADADSLYLLRFRFINLLSGCDSLIERYFQVNAVPVADLGPDQSTCSPDPIVLDAGNPGASYLWNDGSTAQTLVANNSGKYWVQVTSPGGCVSSDTVNILFNQPQAVDLGPDITVCSGTDVILDAGITGVSYLWSTGETTRTIQVNTAGTYSLIATTSAGCMSYDTIAVGFNAKPNAGFTIVQTGGSSFSFTPAVTGKSYLWQFGNGFLSSLESPSIDFQANGNYTVKLLVTDTLTGCKDSSMQVINLTTTGIPASGEVQAMVNAYPNPFSERATVEIYLPVAANVGMEVTDVTGRLISVNPVRQLESGVHQFYVDAAANSAGLYIVRVSINGIVKTFKINEIR